jgi:hypothetical protein
MHCEYKCDVGMPVEDMSVIVNIKTQKGMIDYTQVQYWVGVRSVGFLK